MQTILEPQRRTPLNDRYDVVVAGAGTAGIIAAVAAARNDARVLLLERGGFLGGHIATQLLEHSAGWFDARGARTVGGIPQELVDRLVRAGASPGHIRDDTGYTRFRVPVNHEKFKSVVTAMVAEAGVDFLLFSPIVSSIVEHQQLHAVLVENKSGRTAYAVRAAVDTSGDADLAHAAGCEFLAARDGSSFTQPVSLLFKLGGIDHRRLVEYVAANPGDFKLGIAPQELAGQPHINLWGFGSLLQRAFADGVVSLQRNELHYSGWTLTGEAVINVTRYAADATRAEDLARAETVLRKQVLEFLEFFRRYVPGGEHSYLAATASCVGVRESRRIRGVYELSDEDVRSGRTFPDVVARGGFPIDSHDPRGPSMDAAEPVAAAYDIPYRALLPAAADGIVVAGRCISASRKALASARITGTCMAMGQAAGTAAALAAASNTPLRALDVGKLQRILRDQGADLGAAALSGSDA